MVVAIAAAIAKHLVCVCEGEKDQSVLFYYFCHSVRDFIDGSPTVTYYKYFLRRNVEALQSGLSIVLSTK